MPQISYRTCSVEGAFYLSSKDSVYKSSRLFVIGLIAAIAAKTTSLSPRTVLFIKTGLCGGFTTFSTFALETETLIKTGHAGLAILYAVLSVVVGIALVFAGQMIAGK